MPVQDEKSRQRFLVKEISATAQNNYVLVDQYRLDYRGFSPGVELHIGDVVSAKITSWSRVEDIQLEELASSRPFFDFRKPESGPLVR
jgi:hypothetical protein